jgi:hypothetical protein
MGLYGKPNNKMKKNTIQNTGVTLLALSGNENISMDSYYGWIEEI